MRKTSKLIDLPMCAKFLEVTDCSYVPYRGSIPKEKGTVRSNKARESCVIKQLQNYLANLQYNDR